MTTEANTIPGWRLAGPGRIARCLGGFLLFVSADTLALGERDAPERRPVQQPHDAGEASTGSWRATASMLEEYRFRTAGPPVVGTTSPLGEPPASGRTNDHDARFLFDGQVTGLEDHFRSLLSGELRWDLDGPPRPGAPSFMAEPTDPARPWWTIYGLSVEWANHGRLDYLRAGRQTSEHGLPITFDGVSVEGRPAVRHLSLFAFGGRTVHFFETEPGLLENWVISAGATLRPEPGLRLEADWRVLGEEVTAREKIPVRVLNHSYGLALAKRFDQISSRVFARGLDHRLSHLGGAVLAVLPARIGFDLRAVGQLVTLGEVAESEHPFYSMLGPSLPHVRYQAEVWKEFELGTETTLGVHLGGRGRSLIHHAERPFNRNTGGAYVQLQCDELGAKGLYASGLVEWTFRPGQGWQESFLVLGGSTGYRRGPVRTELGTYYQQYKVSYYQVAEELQDTRTVYGLGAFRLLPELELRARYEVELLDRYLQTLTLGLRQDL